VGFNGKFAVLAAALDGGNTAAAIVAMIAAAIAAFAYLRWASSLFAEPTIEAPPLHVPWASRVVITLSVLYTIVFGIDPGWLSTIANHGALLFHP
jgi:NADH-quinone oxidoreductase subunit N